MLKNRLFVYGLGFGLIFGAVLLQLMNAVEKLESSPNVPSQAMTAEQLQAHAEKLNYKLVSKDQPIYSDKDLEAIRLKAAEDERSRLAKQAPQPSQPASAQHTRTVYISDRMDASAVAQMFAEANIVPDAKTLIAALEDKQLTTRIRYGVYTFVDNTAIDEIIAKITTPG